MERTLYFLSYDLIKAKDYQKLYDELSIFGASRVLESVWCFRYNRDSSRVLRDHFMLFIDNDDRLLVIESADWGGVNLQSDPNEV
ncbi:hypothetical protein ACXYMT_13970 [Salinimicrobium sp. CAU 1759]